eukprot:scaffold42761_cov47-Attheya_sp.AAC.1
MNLRFLLAQSGVDPDQPHAPRFCSRHRSIFLSPSSYIPVTVVLPYTTQPTYDWDWVFYFDETSSSNWVGPDWPGSAPISNPKITPQRSVH